MALLTPSAARRSSRSTSRWTSATACPGWPASAATSSSQRGSIAAVFRRIPFDIKNYDDLNLPDVVATFSHLPAGLVLVTGPTGLGQVHHPGRDHPGHLAQPAPATSSPSRTRSSSCSPTTWPPSPSARSAPTPRRSARPCATPCGRTPTSSWSARCATWRPSATVITAAETGHLVFSTLHTNSAAQTIDRIIDAFPADQQDQVRVPARPGARAVVSMQLVPRADGQGLIPACEILVNSPKISKHIEHGEIKEIHDEIETSVALLPDADA